jgi:hypothetical protein
MANPTLTDKPPIVRNALNETFMMVKEHGQPFKTTRVNGRTVGIRNLDKIITYMGVEEHGKPFDTYGIGMTLMGIKEHGQTHRTRMAIPEHGRPFNSPRACDIISITTDMVIEEHGQPYREPNRIRKTKMGILEHGQPFKQFKKWLSGDNK